MKKEKKDKVDESTYQHEEKTPHLFKPEKIKKQKDLKKKNE